MIYAEIEFRNATGSLKSVAAIMSSMRLEWDMRCLRLSLRAQNVSHLLINRKLFKRFQMHVKVIFLEL